MKGLPRVTDHAVIRYLERALGLDVESVRQRIAREARNGIAAGATGLTVDGLTFVIKPGRVVTVLRGHDDRYVRRSKGQTPLGGVRK